MLDVSPICTEQAIGLPTATTLLKHKIQDLIDQKLWDPSKDVISTPQRAFAPWYPIAPTSARLRSQLKNEEDFP